MKSEYIKKNRSEITFNIIDGKITFCKLTDSHNSTARVYKDGYIGVAGALGGFVGEAQLNELAKKALSNKVEYAEPQFNPSTVKEVVNKTYLPDNKKLKQTVNRIARKIKNPHSEFIINGTISLFKNNETYLNSEKTKLSHKFDYLSVFFSIKSKKSHDICDAYYYKEFNKFGDISEKKMLMDIDEICNALSNEIDLPEGEYNIIYDTDSIFEIIENEFDGETYVSGGSVLSEKLSQKIFSDKLSLYVDNNPHTNLSSAFFDAEGEYSKNYRSPLVSNGIFKGLSTNKNTAQIYNLPLSKTSDASYDGVPFASLSSIYVSPAHKNLDEAGCNDAIIISTTSGGDMSTDGIIAMPIQTGFVVKGGKLIGRVSGLSVNENLFDLLGKNYIGASEKTVWHTDEKPSLISRVKLLKTK